MVEVDGKNQLDCFWGRKTPIINDYDFTGWTAPDLVSPQVTSITKSQCFVYAKSMSILWLAKGHVTYFKRTSIISACQK